jgi:hypothetical protein
VRQRIRDHQQDLWAVKADSVFPEVDLLRVPRPSFAFFAKESGAFDRAVSLERKVAAPGDATLFKISAMDGGAYGRVNRFTPKNGRAEATALTRTIISNCITTEKLERGTLLVH